jgi:hypothetical protein
VLVVEVDGVDPKPVQRAVNDVPDDVGTAGDAPLRLAFDRIDVPPELSGDHDLALVRGECLCRQRKGQLTASRKNVVPKAATVVGRAGRWQYPSPRHALQT